MIEALRDGAVDIIVSSHDPQDVDTKRLPFADAAAGAIGLETLLGAALRLHHNGDVPLLRLVEALSSAPARLFGLPGGTLAPGAAPTWSWSTSTSRGSCRSRHPFALEEHLLRRARGCKARSCKPWSQAAQYLRPFVPDRREDRCWLLAAPGLRLSARLDPVWPADHACGRAWAMSARSAPAISARPTCCAPATRGWPR